MRRILSASLSMLCVVFLAGCEKPPQKEAKYIKRGNLLFAQGEYAKARLEYKNAEQIMPTDAEPRYRLGLVDEAQGDPRNAFANYLGAEQQNPHYHPALLKIANYLIAAEDYDEADHRLNIVLHETPDDAEGHALRASILLRRKEFEGTEKEARIALAKDPGNVTATAVLAGLYSAQNNSGKAVDIINQGIARNPVNLSLLLIKVMLYEQANDLPGAAAAYGDVFKLKPDEPVFRSDLAALYRKAGKLDEAEATLRAGVAAMPNNWDMKKELVVFLNRNRDMAASEGEVRTLMQQYPKNDELYFWLADIYISHQATDKAVALLEQIISNNKSDSFALGARTDLAHIQYRKGNRELAEKLVNAVLEKDPGNQNALFIRAQMSFDRGSYKDAVSDLRAIIRDNPHSQEALSLLGETLLLEGYTDLAIDTMNQLVEIEPTNTAARVRLAQMYNLNGNSGRAMEFLAWITKNYPEYAVGWESMARVALDMKDWRTAQTAIDKLDALPQQQPVATYLQAQLLNLSGKPENALPLYIQVFTAAPASPLAEHALASYVNSMEHMNRLQETVDTLKTITPPTPFIYTLMGECYIKLGKMQDAATAFDMAIAARPAYQAPYLGRAEIYRKENKPDQALAMLQQAQKAAPADVQALMISARLQALAGQYDKAIALYNAVLERHPTADAAANNLAEIIADYQYQDRTALEKARQMAERFVNSDNPVYLDTLGWIYYRQGDFQQAQTIMQRIIAMQTPLPPEVHYHLGILLLKAGRRTEAKAQLMLATATGANYTGLQEAKQTLGGL